LNLAACALIAFARSLLLNVGSEVGMMMVTVMVMAVNNHHNLCLRRIRHCEAEDEYQS
jgi:hypothetical protein